MTKYRLYDYALGRFVNVDPLADALGQDSWTPYHYVFNNPILYNDPYGDICIPCFVIPGIAILMTLGAEDAVAPTKNPKKDAEGRARSAKFRGEAQAAAFTLITFPLYAGQFEETGGDDITVPYREGEGPNESTSDGQESQSPEAPVTDELYKRPNNATTPAQRESVQGQPCATCGKDEGQKNVADHKKELVKEYYETGTIDKDRMRSKDAVQPQCEDCSRKQGKEMSDYSKRMKKIIKERTSSEGTGSE